MPVQTENVTASEENHKRVPVGVTRFSRNRYFQIPVAISQLTLRLEDTHPL